MDCRSCVAEIEHAVAGIPGVSEVKVSLASQLMTFRVDDSVARPPEVERAVAHLGYQLARVDPDRARTDGDADELPENVAHIGPS